MSAGPLVLAQLAWPILERIQIAGDLAVSPHGIAIAVGFLVGAQYMLRVAQRRGVARRRLDPGQPLVADVIQSLATRAALGSIVGARVAYVATRLDQFPDPLSWFRVWEGGLSLLGGIAGAVLAGIPYVRKQRLSLPLVLDSVAPGLALGIFIGRIGDLVIGEHLGASTDFVLGWRCTDNIGIGPPQPWPGPTAQGCFDTAVHQTALYDFLAGGIVFGLLLLLQRRARPDGFFVSAFVVLYGSGRFVSDFARAADRDLVGIGLTGSQISAVLAIAAVVVWWAVRRPGRTTPYAWDPPDFPQGWGRPPPRVVPGDHDGSGATPAGDGSATGAPVGAGPEATSAEDGDR